MAGNLVETLIGAAVLIVAGVFMTIAYTKADLKTVGGYELIAKFEKIDGIGVGSDVTMSGIKIGTVTKQELDKQSFLAVLSVSLENDVQLPEDSAIKVASSGLLGDQYLAIDPGGADELLAPGDEIRFTQGSVDLVDLLGKAIYNSGGGS